MSDQLAIKQTPIPGFYEIDLVVLEDQRGWFKENYQKQKLETLGLPHFDIVQNNISLNGRGATRGLHAEPWVKFISLASGSCFGAWVDLRKGDSFGKTYTLEMSPAKAVLVPKGVANGFQTLEDNTLYSYLVSDYWSADAKYSYVNLFDPDLAIKWPLPKEQAIFSDKDANHPLFKDVTEMDF